MFWFGDNCTCSLGRWRAIGFQLRVQMSIQRALEVTTPEAFSGGQVSDMREPHKTFAK